MTHSFSIIIPTYNRASFVTRAIKSALAQRFTDFEILVVDDGSHDNTESVVRSIRDGRLQYIRRPNGERGAARNTGVAHAAGRYVTFLDSDDIIYPNHLSQAFDFLEANQSPAIFHQAYEITAENGVVLKKLRPVRNINREIITGNPLSCLGVFVRMDIMRQNLFNEDRDLSGLEDWELWLRMAAKHKILSSQGITAAMIQHSDRSVMEVDPEKLVLKMNKFIKYVSTNPDNQLVYGRSLRKTIAGVKTYTALHLAMAKASKREAVKYLTQGILENPLEILRKRFFVTLKLILLG